MTVSNSESRILHANTRLTQTLRALLTNYATLLLLGLLVIAFTVMTDRFMTVQNWQNLLVVQSVVSCVAFAGILPLVVGEFDLSLGNMLGFITMFGAFLSGRGYGVSGVVASMLLAGVVGGLLNGVLTVYFRISSFIATLGTGILLSGFALALSGGQVLFDGIPEELLNLGQAHFLGLGVTVWLTLAMAIVLIYVLEHTPFGRKLYAIGGSERVAFMAGIRTSAIKIVAFAIAGLIISVGAVFALGQNGAANAGFGPDLLLPAYAAAFLGVTTYQPGYYNIPGTLVAILLMAVGFNGLNLLGAPFWAQPIFNGAVLIVAVIIAKWESDTTKR
jgi:ribose transport system permease protein